MHRTTILLPDDLYKSAGRTAKAMGVSLGELIRRRLAQIGTDATDDEKRPAFFRRQPWSGDVPRDLSANHDQYLYGE